MSTSPSDPIEISLSTLGKAGDFGALAHFADPALYDLAYADRTEDVSFYVREARRSAGAILEYGAGNGRITLPIAQARKQITAVDLSVPMLDDLCRRRAKLPPHVAERIDVQLGDMRTLQLEGRFDLIIAPFNTVLHLYTHDDVRQFLARVFEHLDAQGQFIFDFGIPHPADLCRDPEVSYPGPSFCDPRTGHRIEYAERFEYEPLRQLLVTWMEHTPERGEAWTIPLAQRQFFPMEMEALVEHAGFEIVERTSDFSEEAPHCDTDFLALRCVRRS